MFAKLTGILDSAAEGSLILDVGGVGYLVNVSARTLANIGKKGDPLSLLIDTNVREDAISLFGFFDAAEQTWFRLLTSVQGVGAKAGMAILSSCPPERLGLAIMAGDAAALKAADGVGPKLATRILTELKDKAGKLALSPQRLKVSDVEDKPQEQDQGIDHDAISALIHLGYGRSDAYAAIIKVRGKSNDNSDLQQLIKLALKELAS